MAEVTITIDNSLNGKLAVRNNQDYQLGFDTLEEFMYNGSRYLGWGAIPNKNQVIGKYTGRVRPGYKEVELFNHGYRADGQIVRFVWAWDADFIVMNNATNLVLSVWKWYYSVDGTWSYFPDVSPTYIQDGSTPQYWDDYFGNFDIVQAYEQTNRPFYYTGSELEVNGKPQFIGYGKSEYDLIGTNVGQNNANTPNPGGKPAIWSNIYAENVTNNSVKVHSRGLAQLNGGVTKSGFVISRHAHPLVDIDREISVEVFDAAVLGEYPNTVITGLSPNTTYYIRAFVANAKGANYSANKIIKTSASSTLTKPIVEAVTTESMLINQNVPERVYGEISYSSIPVGIKVFSDGGSPITEFGYCCSTNPNPTVNDTKQIFPNLGIFTIDIIINTLGSYNTPDALLSPNTTYYIRPYATNALGTTYGEQSIATTLDIGDAPSFEIGAVYDITKNSFKIRAFNLVDGDSPVIPKWSGGLYTLALYRADATGWPLQGFSGSVESAATLRDNIFQIVANTFFPIQAGVSYIVKIEAKNIYGTTIVVSPTFTMLADEVVGKIPEVYDRTVTLITSTTATILSTIAVTNGNISAHGFVWDTNPNPTIALATRIDNGAGTGNSTANITGLSSNTKYYVRAYATNETGIAYGQGIEFTTSATNVIQVPQIGTLGCFNLMSDGGQFAANILNDGGALITAMGLVWSTAGQPSMPSNTSSSVGVSGAITERIAGLARNTTVNVRAYAQNSAGYGYSNMVTITTLNVPTLTTNPITAVTANSLVSGGNITSAGGAGLAVTARGIVWSKTQNPTIGLPTKTSNGTGIGAFESNATGLTAGTWYVRAYATNSIGTAYGNEQTVTIAAVVNEKAPGVSVNSVKSEDGVITAEVEVRAATGVAITELGAVFYLKSNPMYRRTVKVAEADTGTGIFQLTVDDLPQSGDWNVTGYVNSTEGITTSSQESIYYASSNDTGLTDSFLDFPSNPLENSVYTIKGRKYVYNREGFVELITASDSLKLGGLTKDELLAELNGDTTVSNLNGTSYLMVYGTGTPIENSAELQAAYNAAKNMPRYLGSLTSETFIFHKGQTFTWTPSDFPDNPIIYGIVNVTQTAEMGVGDLLQIVGAATQLSSEAEAKSVRTTVIVAPGDYRGATAFVHDTSGIDIVSLTGNPDVMLDGINVTVNDVFLKGLNLGENPFTIQDSLSDNVYENCKGGDSSFNGMVDNISDGTFINCVGGNTSFGSNSIGKYINCTGLSGCFGSLQCSGIYTNCNAGINAFLNNGNPSSAKLYYCNAGSGSNIEGADVYLYCIDGDGRIYSSIGTEFGDNITIPDAILSTHAVTKRQLDAAIISGGGGGDMFKSDNLSGLSNITTAKTNLGLNNVNNTSDANKPISAATLTALLTKAPKENPEFTGTLTLNGEPLEASTNFKGSNYLMVYGTGTPTENATELQAAYDEAKTMPRYLGVIGEEESTHFYPGQTFKHYIDNTYFKSLVDIITAPIYENEAIAVQITGTDAEAEAKSVRTTLIVAPGDYNYVEMPKYIGDILDEYTTLNIYKGQTFKYGTGVYYVALADILDTTFDETDYANIEEITEVEAKALPSAADIIMESTSIDVVSLTGNSDVKIDGVYADVINKGKLKLKADVENPTITQKVTQGLVGTVTSNGTLSIVGVGTNFNSFNIGDVFTQTSGSSITFTIASITDNTHLTATANVTGYSSMYGTITRKSDKIISLIEIPSTKGLKISTDVFADNAAAAILPTDTIYRTATGQLMIKY